MKKKTDSFPEELSPREQQIISCIKEEPVPPVSSEEIRKTCQSAACRRAQGRGLWETGFWKAVCSCLTIKSALFWLLAAFVLGSCVALLPASRLEPLAFLTALSPVPMLAFIIRELQYRDIYLAELEKTCKYPPEKLYFARLWIGMGFNTLLVLLAGAAARPHYQGGILLRFYLCSFTAMLLVGGVALMLMSLMESALPLSLMMAAWMLGASWLLSQDGTMEMVLTAGTAVLLCGLLFSLGVFAAAAVKASAKLYT